MEWARQRGSVINRQLRFFEGEFSSKVFPSLPLFLATFPVLFIFFESFSCLYLLIVSI